MIIILVKSNKKAPELLQLLKNVALLTECSQYTGGTHYLPSGVIVWELLKRGFVDRNIGLVDIDIFVNCNWVATRWQ
jgi:hypothetical protein